MFQSVSSSCCIRCILVSWMSSAGFTLKLLTWYFVSLAEKVSLPNTVWNKQQLCSTNSNEKYGKLTNITCTDTHWTDHSQCTKFTHSSIHNNILDIHRLDTKFIYITFLRYFAVFSYVKWFRIDFLYHFVLIVFHRLMYQCSHKCLCLKHALCERICNFSGVTVVSVTFWMWVFGIAEENEPFSRDNLKNQIFWNLVIQYFQIYCANDFHRSSYRVSSNLFHNHENTNTYFQPFSVEIEDKVEKKWR